MKAAADEEVARTGNASRTVVKVNLGEKPFGDNLIAMLPLSYANHGEYIPVSAHGPAVRGGERNHGKSIIATSSQYYHTSISLLELSHPSCFIRFRFGDGRACFNAPSYWINCKCSI